MPDTLPIAGLPSLDPVWSAVLAPVLSVLVEAVRRLELVPDHDLRLVDPGAPVTAHAITLDAAVLEPGPRTAADAAWIADNPEDLAALGLDRWRRAAGLLLEAIALAALDEDAETRDAPAWWRLGRAAEAVDRAAPALGWLWPEAVDLLRHPERGLVAAPRRAAWLFRWRRDHGAELPPMAPDGALLARFAQWCRDRGVGLASLAPLPIEPAPASTETRWQAEPLSWRVVSVEGGPTGTLLRGRGLALAATSAVGTGERGLTIAAAVDPGPVEIVRWPAGPLGTWRLNTGKIGGRVGAARGVELTLTEQGQIELVMADAFMGLPTPEMLELSESVGVSGHARGRFRVAHVDPNGDGELVIDELVPRGLTVHPRTGRRYALPAAAVIGPAEQVLASLAGQSLRWRERAGELFLDGTLSGMQVELRLKSTVHIAEGWA